MQFPSTPFFLPLVGRVSNNKRWQILSNDYSIFVPIPIFCSREESLVESFACVFCLQEIGTVVGRKWLEDETPRGYLKPIQWHAVLPYIYIYIQFRRFVRLVSPRINVWGARGEEERKKRRDPGEKRDARIVADPLLHRSQKRGSVVGLANVGYRLLESRVIPTRKDSSSCPTRDPSCSWTDVTALVSRSILSLSFDPITCAACPPS